MGKYKPVKTNPTRPKLRRLKPEREAVTLSQLIWRFGSADEFRVFRRLCWAQLAQRSGGGLGSQAMKDLASEAVPKRCASWVSPALSVQNDGFEVAVQSYRGGTLPIFLDNAALL